MEIHKLSSNSIKIKGKNSSIAVDPLVKTEAGAIIATQPIESLAIDKVEGQRLIISGPGEYETGGISITGKQGKSGFIYQIVEEAKIMFVSSDNTSTIPDDEEFDCLIVKVVSDFKDDSLGPINRKCTVLYGNLDLATVKSESKEVTSKVNLKKTQEISGKTFLLS